MRAAFVCDGAAQRRVHRWCLPSIPTAITTTREEVAFFLHRVFDFFLFHVNTNKYHQLHHLLLTILLFVDYCGQLSNVMYLELAALLLELHSAPLKLSLFD